MKGTFIRKTPLRSPLDLSALFSEHERLQRLRADAENAHSDFLSKSETLLRQVEERMRTLIMPSKGEKGDRGAPGKDGKNGETPDIDYATIIKEVVKMIPPAKSGKDGEDGKSPSVKEIVEAIKKNLTVEHIPGLKREIDLYRNQLAGKIYGKDTWARGGGDTVAAGAGVTITTNADGKKVIASSTGTQVYGEVVSGSGTSFTLAHTPTSGIALFGRGQRITNFTLVGTAITTNDTWAAGDLTADYVY